MYFQQQYLANRGGILPTEPATTTAGYSVTWDNVQVQGHTKHQNSASSNPFVMLAMCFGAVNRVPTIGLSETDTVAALEVPPTSFIPTIADHCRRAERVIILVKRMMVDLLPWLRDMSANRHIVHANAARMAEQSQIVSL